MSAKRKQANAPRGPRTPAEWQEAVNGAAFMLRLESAILYGLVEGPRANVEPDRKAAR